MTSSMIFSTSNAQYKLDEDLKNSKIFFEETKTKTDYKPIDPIIKDILYKNIVSAIEDLIQECETLSLSINIYVTF